MKTAVLIISFAFIFAVNTEAYTPVDLFAELNSQIKNMTALIIIIKKTYRDDPYHHPLPKEYFTTLNRAEFVLKDARNIVDRTGVLGGGKKHKSLMDRERNNPRRSILWVPREAVDWYKDREEDQYYEDLETRERYNPRRSFGKFDERFVKPDNFPDSTEAINEERRWKTNVYKAIASALKDKFENESVMRPSQLQRRRQ